MEYQKLTSTSEKGEKICPGCKFSWNQPSFESPEFNKWYQESLKCCNPACEGRWAWGCWHCHTWKVSPLYLSEAIQKISFLKTGKSFLFDENFLKFRVREVILSYFGKDGEISKILSWDRSKETKQEALVIADFWMCCGRPEGEWLMSWMKMRKTGWEPQAIHILYERFK